MAQFRALYRQVNNNTEWETLQSGHSAKAAIAARVLWKAIQASDSIDYTKVMNEFLRSSYPMFFGRFAWKGSREQTLSPYLFQFYNFTAYGENYSDTGVINDRVTMLVGPPQIQQADIVFPMPTWEERIFDNSFGSNAEIIVTVITLSFSFLSIICLIYVLSYWNDPFIVAINPSFLVILIIGSFFAYASVFTFMPSLISTASCHLKVWLIGSAFIFMFGALLSKAFKYYIIKKHGKLSGTHIFNRSIWLVSSMLFGIEIILLAIFTGVSNLEAVLKKPDIYRRSTWKYNCEVSTQYWFILGLLLGFNVLLGLVGVFLTFQIRNRFKESNLIGFAMYNILFFGLLVTIIQSVSGINVDARFITTDLLIIAGTAITLHCIFGQRILILFQSWSKNDNDSSAAVIETASEKKRLMEGIKLLEKELESLNEALATLEKNNEELSKKHQEKQTLYHELCQKYKSKTTGSTDEGDETLSYESSITVSILGE
eukprot:TRINITY_DN5097_c0_g2_i1.p1 TRINITY_DN5097_c0_g2~~TRINITY_DN5097_c0_g2_i1.p1  ORF type:complete len:542 (+),score=69.89 TRINITY_DN5097_c0_g2_i1:171-1628(+)